ncbi:hypothetical protein, partial [Pseudomonas aeruginosa]|uniref:hypothetical protein n=1 Tax=Pseudomonas aeruginosa TaxID=287 RepID=UPI00196931AC
IHLLEGLRGDITPAAETEERRFDGYVIDLPRGDSLHLLALVAVHVDVGVTQTLAILNAIET